VLHAAASALALPVAALCLAPLAGPGSTALASALSADGDGTAGGDGAAGAWAAREAALLVALLFAAHPVHVEAVANTTGRAEVLCALFYFAGFLAFAAAHRGQGGGGTGGVRSVAACGGMLACAWCSTLCKEHGATLPLVAVAWDALLGTSTSLPELWRWAMGAKTLPRVLARAQRDLPPPPQSLALKLPRSPSAPENAGEEHAAVRRRALGLFLLRSALAVGGCGLLVGWRLGKNANAAVHGGGGGGGGDSSSSLLASSSSPDFSCEQNPGACLAEPLDRFLHFSWLACVNLGFLAWPAGLSPDWSGPSIRPLVVAGAAESGAAAGSSLWQREAPRLAGVALLHGCLAVVVALALAAAATEPVDCGGRGAEDAEDGNREGGAQGRRRRRWAAQPWARPVVVGAAWLVATAVLSTNLLVHVGFVVADRTLYLPCFGSLLLAAVALYRAPLAEQAVAEQTMAGQALAGQRTEAAGDQAAKLVQSPPLPLSPPPRPPSLARRLVLRWWRAGFASAALALCVVKQQRQTALWRDPALLWAEALRVNPLSCIAGTELGMSLVNAGRPRDAAAVLWEAHRRELESNWSTLLDSCF